MTVILPSFIMILLKLFGSMKYVNQSTERSGKRLRSVFSCCGEFNCYDFILGNKELQYKLHNLSLSFTFV